MVDFSIYKYNYDERVGNLDKEAASEVKSEKHFPLFEENGKLRIFKPLSKTKPLTTPLFAYSEVFWSNIINRYFDSEAPIYNLAFCENIEKLAPKYYEIGTVVDSVLGEGEELINLYEYFRDNKDQKVNIDDYINYCEKLYDYSFFFESDFLQDNKQLSSQLAKQILLSILRADQNFHYENVSFIIDSKNNISRLAPPIDHEFSTMFLYPDDKTKHKLRFGNFIGRLSYSGDHKTFEDSLLALAGFKNSIVKNLDAICEYHPKVADEFIHQLREFSKDFRTTSKTDFYLQDNGFLVPFNSNEWLAGQKEYKDGNKEAADELRKGYELYRLDLKKFNNKVREEVLETSKVLEKQLERRI